MLRDLVREGANVLANASRATLRELRVDVFAKASRCWLRELLAKARDQVATFFLTNTV